ncbi:hypothetical protein [Methanocalculus sp. MC3]|jgi:hypothetical protein
MAEQRNSLAGAVIASLSMPLHAALPSRMLRGKMGHLPFIRRFFTRRKHSL